MASVLLRRSATTAMLAVAATVASPLLALEGVAHAANAPAETSSFPPANGAMVTSQSVTVTYDQAITPTPGTPGLQVWSYANGTRQNSVAGAVTTTNSNPLTPQTKDTIKLSPLFPMATGVEYEALATVDGVSGATSNGLSTRTDFFFWVVDKTAPATSAPSVINNTNENAVPFKGHAAPGLTVTVTLSQGGAPLATGTSNVPTCSTAPSCPFTVPVNASNLGDGSYTWSVSAADANGTATNASTGSITKDTSAPCSVPNACQPTMSYSSSDNAVTVTAPAPNNAGITKWHVTVADQDGHAIGPFTYPVNNSNLNAAGLDVSGLDDGTLTASVIAEDAAGNESAPQTATAAKDTGLHVDFADSYFTNNNGNVTLPNAEVAATKSPTSLTLLFDQPIESSFSDATSNKTYDTTVCVVDRFNNCAVYSTSGQISSDGRSLTVPVSTQLADTASPYTIQVTAFSKNLCPTRTPANTTPSNTWSCETTSGPVTNPSQITETTLQDSGGSAQFTFDTTPPAAPSVVLPNVDANNIKAVAVSGHTEPGSRVDVTLTSSGGGNQLVANPGGTTADGSGNFSFNVNVSSLPDGALTALATATDAAGNQSATGNGTSTLQARPSAPQAVSATPGDSSALVTWTPPATSGGHPVSGYSVTYADTTAGTARQSVGAAGTATSALLSGLVNGHNYSISVIASNDIGSGPAGTTGVTPRGNSRMTLSRSHATITDGQSVTLIGHLTEAASGNGIGNAPVTVATTYDNGGHGPTFHVTSDQFGYWQLTTKPTKNISFAATYAGSTAYNAVATATRVLVRVAVRITKVSATSSSHASAVTFSGNVAPNERGRTVYLYEQVGKKLVKLGSVHLGSKSTWTYRRTFSKGTHHVFARFLSQNGSTGADSSTVTVKRT